MCTRGKNCEYAHGAAERRCSEFFYSGNDERVAAQLFQKSSQNEPLENSKKRKYEDLDSSSTLPRCVEVQEPKFTYSYQFLKQFDRHKFPTAKEKKLSNKHKGKKRGLCNQSEAKGSCTRGAESYARRTDKLQQSMQRTRSAIKLDVASQVQIVDSQVIVDVKPDISKMSPLERLKALTSNTTTKTNVIVDVKPDVTNMSPLERLKALSSNTATKETTMPKDIKQSTTARHQRSERRKEKDAKYFQKLREKEAAREKREEEKAAFLSNIPCKFFARGICQYGDECPFFHDPDVALLRNECINKPKNEILCKFVASRSCSYGDSCSYSHDTARFPCHYYVLDGYSCLKGARCRFSHKLDVSEEEKRLLLIKMRRLEMQNEATNAEGEGKESSIKIVEQNDGESQRKQLPDDEGTHDHYQSDSLGKVGLMSEDASQAEDVCVWAPLTSVNAK
jgi:hypothetical protein